MIGAEAHSLMLYECQMTWNVWENIIIFLSKVLGTELRSPALCILGIITEGVGLSAQQTLLRRLSLTTGCRIVLMHWKTKNIILFNEWLGEMTNIASYEQLIFKLNNRQEVFLNIWGPYWIQYWMANYGEADNVIICKLLLSGFVRDGLHYKSCYYHYDKK